MGTLGKRWVTESTALRLNAEEAERRRFEFLKSLFPADPLMKFRRDHTFRQIRIVTQEDFNQHPPVDISSLPNGYWRDMQSQRNFSGLTLQAAEKYEVEAHFIQVWDAMMLNPAKVHCYPTLDQCTVEQLVEEGTHWLWAGSWRTVPFMIPSGGMGGRLFHPQASYKADTGQWRRIAAGTLLLGHNWENQCLHCGVGCLRPDHWRNLLAWAGVSGKGRPPRPEHTSPRYRYTPEENNEEQHDDEDHQ